MMTVASPCIDDCRLDARDVCVGCRRSLEEIVAWGRLSDPEKRRILAALPARKPEAARP
jgi:predicted Fe-S protein YdhL (DUF1289 family)